MNVEELLARETIRHIMGKYSIAGDEYNVDDYLSCFLEDGVLEFDPFPGKGHLRLDGEDAIREFISGFFGAMQSGQVTVPGDYMRHHLTTSRVDFVDNETAKARTYALYSTKNGVESSGIYHDVFKRSGDQWLISHRIWRVDEK